MANTKKDIEVKELKVENNTTETKNMDSKDKMIEMLTKQIEENNKRMLEMQQSFIALQSKSSEKEKVSYNDDNELIELGTRFINGVTIYSPNRDTQISMVEDRLSELTKDELRSVLKSNWVKEWIEKDILFFKDELMYERYKIRKSFRMDDEYLEDMFLDKNSNDVEIFLNNITKNFRDEPIIHCLFYRIVELVSDGKLSTMSYEIRKTIEKCFKFSIENAQMYYKPFKKIIK